MTPPHETGIAVMKNNSLLKGAQKGRMVTGLPCGPKMKRGAVSMMNARPKVSSRLLERIAPVERG